MTTFSDPAWKAREERHKSERRKRGRPPEKERRPLAAQAFDDNRFPIITKFIDLLPPWQDVIVAVYEEGFQHGRDDDA